MSAIPPAVPISRMSMSSYCRNENHLTCRQMGMRCTCDCHPQARDGRPRGAEMRPVKAPPNAAVAPAPAPARPNGATPAPALPSGMVWEAPIPPRRGPQAGPVVADEIVELLRANPGKWARVRTAKASATPHGWRKKVEAGALGDGWDAKAGKLPDGGFALWLRYRGD